MLSTKLVKPKVDASDVSTEGLKIKVPENVKSIGMTALKAGGIGAAVGGVVSGVENMLKLSRDEITGAEATGHIVADTTVGAFAGVTGFATGTMGAMALGGIGGVPGIIGAAVAGLVGGVGMDFLMRKTGIRDAISNGVRSILG